MTADDKTPPAGSVTENAVKQSFEDIHEYSRHSYPPHVSHQTLRQQFPQDDGALTAKDPQEFNTSPDRTIYVEYTEGDNRNPRNFSLRMKWKITVLACTFSIFAGTSTSSYSMGFASMPRDLHCTQYEAALGLSLFTSGFGLAPLVTASFSEEFGRKPVYIGSAIGFMSTFPMVALSKNIHTVFLARFLMGSCASTAATTGAGIVSDIWATNERGLPMSMLSGGLICGIGIGPVVAGWVEMNPHLGWKWIQWLHVIFFSAFLVLVPIFLRETRTPVLLTRLAKKIRKDTGNDRYRARIEDERPPLRTLIYISCTRSIFLMFTEPVVFSCSMWIGFAWGIVYCLIQSINGVFITLHGFNVGETGDIFAAMIIGTLLGFLSNVHQEMLYKKYFPTRGPEARLHWACFSAILFPASMFMYAWSSFTTVSWIIQAIAIALFTWATYIIYLAVFSYFADCYGPYASSALAGQNLTRSLIATLFPFLTDKMFNALGYKWANSIFGFIAFVMMPIPYALYFYGPAIRSRSKFSRMVMESPHGT